MNPRMTSVAAFLAVVALTTITSQCAAAEPTILYVSPDGSDNWSGSLKAPNDDLTDGPLRSIAGARDAVRDLISRAGLNQPVNVFIRAGRYQLEGTLVFTPEDSGTDDCPITYAGYPGEQAIISGGRPIANWQKEGANLWRAHIPEVEAGDWYFHQLFVNGRRRQRARIPNRGYLYLEGIINPYDRSDPINRKGFRFKPGDLDSDWTNINDIEIVKLFSWSSTRLPVEKIDETTNTVTFFGSTGGDPRLFDWARNRYYVDNVFEGLDQPGEWYLNRQTGTLYYWPLPGEDMTNAEVYAPAVEQLVRFAGDTKLGLPVTNITLRDLNLRHSSWPLPREGYRERQAQVIVDIAAIYGTGAVRCTLRNIDLAHVGTHGIWLERGCRNNRIVHCRVHDIGAGGIYIGATYENPPSDHNIVDNNFIHHTTQVFQGAIPAWIGRSSYNHLTHNEICDSDYSGVSVGWDWSFAPSSAHHNAIEYNHIHHCGHRRMSDMGGIYTLGVSPGTALRYNRIHHLYCSPAYSHASGIYPDAGSSEMLIENNIVYRCTTSGFFHHFGRDNEVRNNIFAYAEREGISRCRNEDRYSFNFHHNIVYSEHPDVLHRRWSNGNYDIDHNLYWCTEGGPLDFAGNSLQAWRDMGNDIHSHIADPRFTDPEHYDFSLSPDSPALEMGFKPIDTSQIGLYGDDQWVNLPNTIEHMRDDPLPPEPEPLHISADFDTMFGADRKPPLGGHPLHARVHTEDRDHLVGITDETAAGGRQSLKIQDDPELERDYNPHFYYTPNYETGIARSSFDIRIEDAVVMYHEWREWNDPYHVGPSFWIRGDELQVWDETLLSLPIGEWVHIEITAALGEDATGTWQLTVTLPGGRVRNFQGLMVGDPDWDKLNWIGFSSPATHETSYYLDNIEISVRQD